MSLKSECLLYFDTAMKELTVEYPNKEDLVRSLSMVFSDFINEDYEGFSDNKIYKQYLNVIKDIVITAFENDASKSFLRGYFKSLNNKKVIDYLSSLSKTKSGDIKYQLSRLYYEFVYWTDSDTTKEIKVNKLIILIDGWF